jgi:hypothetical protein
MLPSPRPASATSLARAALVALAALAAGCSDMMVERADPALTKAAVDRDAVSVKSIDVDPIMRGTVASEAALVGFDPVVVRGFGLVVGLRETGSRQMPADVRAYMTQELAKRGYGSGRPGAPEASPQELLNSNDTTVVVVEGVIPPGAPKESRFDIRVIVSPGTSTTSLEGGTLVFADLRPGPLFTGSRQPKPLAEAAGAIVINPFVEPNSTQLDTINRMSGRVLDGGLVTKDMPLKLRLLTPSHSRAETIQNTINSLFPREPKQRDETARGKSGDSIDLTVPPSYAKRPGEFAELIRHSPLNIENPEQSATAIRRALLASPGAAGAASWRWQALGKRVLPMIQDLYDYPEEQPRFAALNAGAKLNDQLAVPALLSMARGSDSLTYRKESIKLLTRMGTNAEIELGLRELLDDPEVEVRLSAFDALERRLDPHIAGIELGKKFILNVVPSKYPMIYVTQAGQPRIVIFDEALQVRRPMTLYTWGGRLIMRADEGDEYLEIFHRDRLDAPSVLDRVRPGVAELVSYFAGRPSQDRPEAGIDLSYSETISALHELWRLRYIQSDFRAEQDRILADVLRDDTKSKDIRPEFGDGSEESQPSPQSISEMATQPPSGLEGASVGAGLDSAKARRDTVPR